MPWGSFMPLSSVAQELGKSPLRFACGRREVWAQFGQKDAGQEHGSLLHLPGVSVADTQKTAAPETTSTPSAEF